MQTHNESPQPSISVEDFVTIRQLTTNHPAFTEGGIRALIFRAESQGSVKKKLSKKLSIAREDDRIS
jgi:hypothetical protein